MNRRTVKKIFGICSMRKPLARQHAGPDGLITRFENLPHDQKPYLNLKDDSEEPDYTQSRYLLKGKK